MLWPDLGFSFLLSPSLSPSVFLCVVFNSCGVCSHAPLGCPSGHVRGKVSIPPPSQHSFLGSGGQPPQMSPPDRQLSEDCIPESKYSAQTMQFHPQ